MSEGRQLIPIGAQIEEAEKAFALREREISGQVASGRIRQTTGDLQLARIQAARQTLLWLKKNETAIKARVAGGRA